MSAMITGMRRALADTRSPPLTSAIQATNNAEHAAFIPAVERSAPSITEFVPGSVQLRGRVLL